MIEIKNLTKNFGSTCALNNSSCELSEGAVWGLTGSNGAGKSTLLRILSGIFTQDSGEVIIDGQNAANNSDVKKKCFLISDFPFYYNNETLLTQREIYSVLYPKWDDNKYKELRDYFGINEKQKINSMSKGMQRQTAIILAFSTGCKYIFMDEIFDGLDPVVRQKVKKIIVREIMDSQLTCVIASHNLRELDDICDNLLLLHKGNLIKSNNVDALKSNIHKIQVAFTTLPEYDFLADFDIESKHQSGNYFKLLIRGDYEEIEQKMTALNPTFFEAVPLTLEELFINEMEGIGYES